MRCLVCGSNHIDEFGKEPPANHWWLCTDCGANWEEAVIEVDGKTISCITNGGSSCTTTYALFNPRTQTIENEAIAIVKANVIGVNRIIGVWHDDEEAE